jgi:hypothetical protein
MPRLDDVAVLKSEHAQLRELANVMVGTRGFEGFEGLAGQLSGMIRDHLGLERPLLELAVPGAPGTDDPLAVAALGRLANDLDSRLDSIDPSGVLALLEDHIRLVEEHVIG